MPDTADAVDAILIAMPPREASSEGDDSNPMPVEDIASDEGLDLESDAAPASAGEDSLPYLESQGHFEDLNHGGILLGDIQKARLVAPDWVEERFGHKPTGRSLCLKGIVYAPNEEMLPEQVDALRKVRGTLLAGGRLGLSMVGQRARSAAKVIGGAALPLRDLVRTACLRRQPCHFQALFAAEVVHKVVAHSPARRDDRSGPKCHLTALLAHRPVAKVVQQGDSVRTVSNRTAGRSRRRSGDGHPGEKAGLCCSTVESLLRSVGGSTGSKCTAGLGPSPGGDAT